MEVLAMSNHLSGTITVHDLNDVTVRFSFGRGYIYLPGELTLSDRLLRAAAHLIADEIGLTVVWQDMSGCKHHVFPHDSIDKSFLDASVDPRNHHGIGLEQPLC